jgi:hypothetical protein
MAHITTVSHGNYASVPRRSYLSTDPFNTVIFSYSTALVNQVYVGTLTVLPTATAANCPSGRVLHETGKKLFPGANNGINDYMVSVYDPVSMLTGFINPNQPIFSLMNTDRANFLLDGPSGAGTGLSASGRANALYTRGDVLAGDRLDLSGSALIYGNLSAVSTISNQYVSTFTSTLGTLSVDGKVAFPAGVVVGTETMVGGTLSGTFVRKGVSTTAVKSDSHIFLSYSTISNPGFLSAENLVAGLGFNIVSYSTTVADTGTVNWMVINRS